MSVEQAPVHATRSRTAVGWSWSPAPLTFQHSAPIHRCWILEPDSLGQPAETEVCVKVIHHNQPNVGSTYKETETLEQLKKTRGVLQMLSHFQAEDRAVTYMLLE